MVEKLIKIAGPTGKFKIDGKIKEFVDGKEVKLKCDCCGKLSSSGASNIHDKKHQIICSECLQKAPSHYGFIPAEDLINYIKQKRNKKWWQIWKN
jgi:hypothetical protein